MPKKKAAPKTTRKPRQKRDRGAICIARLEHIGKLIVSMPMPTALLDEKTAELRASLERVKEEFGCLPSEAFFAPRAGKAKHEIAAGDVVKLKDKAPAAYWMAQGVELTVKAIGKSEGRPAMVEAMRPDRCMVILPLRHLTLITPAAIPPQ